LVDLASTRHFAPRISLFIGMYVRWCIRRCRSICVDITNVLSTKRLNLLLSSIESDLETTQVTSTARGLTCSSHRHLGHFLIDCWLDCYI